MMNLDELKSIIANEIKEEGISGLLPENSVEFIAEKVIEKLNFDKSKRDIPDLVSEDINAIDNTQPSDVPVEVSNDLLPGISQENPVSAICPELPDFAKKADPSQIFVFDMNELSEGGENLANKPFRTMENPDNKMSMHDFWIKEGKVKGDVYICKFEKIGELNFNFSNGTAQFVDNKFSDINNIGQVNSGYKENPYNGAPVVSINNNDLETYIKNSVDLQKTVSDMVMKMLKNNVFNNENTPLEIPEPVQPSQNFDLTMQDVVNNDNEYEKIDLPVELNESILKNDTKFLSCENEQIQKWEYDNNVYFTPKDRISKTKGYIKL